MAKPKTGRPRKPVSERRAESINIYFTKRELEAVKSAAGRLSVGQWGRDALLVAAGVAP